MLDQARRKGATDSVVLLRASAQVPPFSDSSADVVFMSMVYHHFADPVVVAKECRRVLRDGGHVCIRNSTCEADFPHRHFLPAMRSLIESELPARNDIGVVFRAAGFTPVLHEIVRQVVAPNWPTFVHKSSLRADSFLARLSNEDFSPGMASCMLMVKVPIGMMPLQRKSIGLCSSSRFDNVTATQAPPAELAGA